MKTIVYPDGSIEQTILADYIVTHGKARFATDAEIADYERAFEKWDNENFNNDSADETTI